MGYNGPPPMKTYHPTATIKCAHCGRLRLCSKLTCDGCGSTQLAKPKMPKPNKERIWS